MRLFGNSYTCTAVDKISANSESRGPCAIAELLANTATGIVTMTVSQSVVGIGLNVERKGNILQGAMLLSRSSLVHLVC